MDAAPLIKEKKPRTEAQIASLEKARLRAKELRATRLQPTLDSDSEEPIEAEQESIPEPDHEPAPEITKSKPKPKQKEKVKKVKEPKQDTEEKEVKEFRKQIQQSPPITAKKYFNMISGLKKTYIMFDEE
jgi:hypothetical protein